MITLVSSAIVRASIQAGNIDTHLELAIFIRMELSIIALDYWTWTRLDVADRIEHGEGDTP